MTGSRRKNHVRVGSACAAPACRAPARREPRTHLRQNDSDRRNLHTLVGANTGVACVRERSVFVDVDTQWPNRGQRLPKQRRRMAEVLAQKRRRLAGRIATRRCEDLFESMK